MKNNTPLTFNLDVEERPVTIDGEDYVLRELDGKQRDKYLEALGKRLVPGKNGKASTLKSFDGLQASLICMCLYKKGEARPITSATIQAWPARVVGSLFDAAKELSGIDVEEEKGKAKKN